MHAMDQKLSIRPVPNPSWTSLAASDDAGGHEDEHDEDEHGEEGGDDGAAGALAESMELHADGNPVGAPVARVRHVHDGRGGGAGRREQRHDQHVAEEQEQPDAARGLVGPEDDHDGEGQRQHQVPRGDGVGHQEEGEGREVVEPRMELEEVGEHGQPLVGGARGDGGRQRGPEGGYP